MSLFSVWCSILPFVNCPYCKGREVCIVKLTSVDLRHASHSFYTANTPCLPLPRKRSPDGVTTWLVIAAIWLQLVIAAYYSFIDPKSMKGRVGLVSWPTADGLYLCITPLCLSLQQWWEQYTKYQDWDSNLQYQDARFKTKTVKILSQDETSVLRLPITGLQCCSMHNCCISWAELEHFKWQWMYTVQKNAAVFFCLFLTNLKQFESLLHCFNLRSVASVSNAGSSYR